MSEKIKNLKNRSTAFASRHKIAITATVTAGACYAISRSSVNSWNEFLEENDLTDKYYRPTDEFGNEL